MEAPDVFSVCLTGWVKSRGHIYRGYCPELGLHATGQTPQEAQAELRERVRLFLLAKREAYENTLHEMPGGVV